jgi:Papain fold toxin 1, glutamine deamidase
VLTSVMLVVGASCGSAGWWCVVGFALGDLGSGHHPYLKGPLATVAALAVSYAVLFTLIVGVPRVARALAASVTPRGWGIPRAVLAALAGGALAYAWSQAAAVLIRPLFIFGDESPPTDAIQPTQTHPMAYAVVAALAIAAFGIVRAQLARTPNGARRILDAGRARANAVQFPLPWPVTAVVRAFCMTVFVSGLSSGLPESFVIFLVFAAVFAVNELLGMVRPYAGALARLPLALRYAVNAAAAFALASFIVVPMFQSSQTLTPLLYALIASVAVTAVLFPSTRRASLAAALLLVVALPAPALADNCSGLTDCFTTGQLAALAAAAIALAVLGGFALAAAAAAEGAELAAAAAAAAEAAEAAEAAAAAGEAAEAAAAAGEAAEAAAAAGEAGEAAAAAGEAGEAAAAAGEAGEAASAAGEAAEGAEAAEAGEATEAGEAAEGPRTPGALESTSAEGYPDFNPSGCTTNCGACADAVENALAGNGVTPASPGVSAWPASGGGEAGLQFPLGGGAADIEAALQAAGDGARGIAYVDDGAIAHVFNVVNNGGNIVAIDGQIGVFGTVTEVGEYGFTNPLQWGFIPTFPP